jgi:hypothetical protein
MWISVQASCVEGSIGKYNKLGWDIYIYTSYLKLLNSGWVQWLSSAIPTTQEAEIKDWSERLSQEKCWWDPYLKSKPGMVIHAHNPGYTGGIDRWLQSELVQAKKSTGPYLKNSWNKKKNCNMSQVLASASPEFKNLNSAPKITKFGYISLWSF